MGNSGWLGFLLRYRVGERACGAAVGIPSKSNHFHLTPEMNALKAVHTTTERNKFKSIYSKWQIDLIGHQQCLSDPFVL